MLVENENLGFDVVLGFDMETDIGSYTPFYEGVKHGSDPILEVLKKHDVLATFYWTGHAAEYNPEMLQHIDKHGHETGCHGLFHETLGDPIFPLPNNWPILESEVEGRLQLATDMVAKACGKQPVSFRCPRLWGSTKVVNVLEKLGYVSDASLPLYFYGEPLSPYHPSVEDWTKPGEMTILEIPNFCDLDMESNDPYQRDRDQWPLFRTISAAHVMSKVQGFVQHLKARGQRPVVCFYLHPWEFYAMPQGAIDFGECAVQPLPFIVENCGQTAVEQFDLLCGMLKDSGARFVTAGALAQEYKCNSSTVVREKL